MLLQYQSFGFRIGYCYTVMSFAVIAVHDWAAVSPTSIWCFVSRVV